MLDATGARALGEIVEQLQRRGVTVLLKGPLPQHQRTLRAVGVLDQLTTEKHVFATLDEAIAHARVHVARIRHGEAPG
jgi:SulP family sulfate permease